ncbi:hypothetical protein HQ531_09420 [bacterium]|nr:hypothetical protein [bacterium]
MKTRILLIAAVALGLFTFSLPVIAGDQEHHMEEQTIIEIPVVGKISILTSTYFADCKLMENTNIGIHNSLVKMMSDSDGKSEHIQLSDLCEELQWKYDEEKSAFEASTFEEIREELRLEHAEAKTHIDIESDQNDIDDLPKMSREIVGGVININGFASRKVITLVYLENKENPLVIEEYYSAKAKALNKISKAREDLGKKLGQDSDDVEGVPDFIKLLYDAVKADEDWAKPKGEVIRFIIKLLDDDDDLIFTMNYDVLSAETDNYQSEHFQLK